MKESNMNYDKGTHLGFIEDTISRMAQFSFQVKTWCITVDSALLALFIKGDNATDNNNSIIWIAVGATFLFLIVGTYYHSLEISYRDYYKEVAENNNTNLSLNYNMELPKQKGLEKIRKYTKGLCAWSTTGFFLLVIGMIILLGTVL